MDDRDEQQEDESTDDSVEIPVNVEGEETLGEESSSDVAEAEGLAEGTSDVEDEGGGESPDVSSDASDQPEAGDDELEDLYVEPNESDVEVVEPEESVPEELDARQVETGEQGETASDAESSGEQVSEEPGESEGLSPEELRQRVDTLEQEIEELEQERDELQEKRDEFEDRMMRAAADLENFRKRAKREKTELKKYGAKPLLEDLIQNIDNLERALEHADSSNEQNIIEGVEMVLRQLHSNLETHGIEQFDSEGEDFDPEQHEAIQQVETTEHETGTIVDEFQKGYFLHDRLLRPAMVSVADNVAEDDEASGGSDEEQDAESAEGEETDEAEQGAETAEENAE